jgi:hypothetical protein
MWRSRQTRIKLLRLIDQLRPSMNSTRARTDSRFKRFGTFLRHISSHGSFFRTGSMNDTNGSNQDDINNENQVKKERSDSLLGVFLGKSFVNRRSLDEYDRKSSQDLPHIDEKDGNDEGGESTPPNNTEPNNPSLKVKDNGETVNQTSSEISSHPGMNRQPFSDKTRIAVAAETTDSGKSSHAAEFHNRTHSEASYRSLSSFSTSSSKSLNNKTVSFSMTDVYSSRQSPDNNLKNGEYSMITSNSHINGKSSVVIEKFSGDRVEVEEYEDFDTDMENQAHANELLKKSINDDKEMQI